MEKHAQAYIQAETLHRFVRTLFGHADLSPEHAFDAAEVLLYASRRGVDTHGVRNLKPLYFTQFAQGVVNLQPEFKYEHETPVSARIDGDRGLGLVAGPWAMRLAMRKAAASGIGMVAMHNSYHYGAAGYYPWMALADDMIGICMTGRFYARDHNYGVMPTFGAKSMFSTNPLSISFPTAQEPPWLLDMSTSTVPFNRIMMMRDNGESIPLGWGVDADGQPTTDPSSVRFLYPLGGTREQGGHKGYNLAMMVSVMCNLLAGGWDQLYPDDPLAFDGYRVDGDSHFFAAMRVDLFRPVDDFKRGMDAMIRALHASPKEPGQERIYVAGEIEHETEVKRLRDGVPLSPVVLNDLQALSQEFGVPLDLI
ncbi:MAG TPA: Ldh family oxidoreductase [Caldilineaceae bacterium]|nr:Ldh family oxidoreductase [Caldilineaceae bacterium]